MSSSRDFVAATLADAALPILRRPVEDLIYETLDARQVPSRTDFKELRDLVNNLRGQLGGVTSGVKRLADQGEALDEQLRTLEGRVDGLEPQVEALAAGHGPSEAAVEAEAHQAAAIVELHEQLDALRTQLAALAQASAAVAQRLDALATSAPPAGPTTQAQLEALGAAVSRLDARVSALATAAPVPVAQPVPNMLSAEIVEDALQRAIPTVLDRIVARRIEAAWASLQTSVPAPAPAAAASPGAPARPLQPVPLASSQPCKVADCTENARARGFCAKHYQHWKRNRLPGFPNPDGN